MVIYFPGYVLAHPGTVRPAARPNRVTPRRRQPDLSRDRKHPEPVASSNSPAQTDAIAREAECLFAASLLAAGDQAADPVPPASSAPDDSEPPR